MLPLTNDVFLSVNNVILPGAGNVREVYHRSVQESSLMDNIPILITSQSFQSHIVVGSHLAGNNYLTFIAMRNSFLFA